MPSSAALFRQNFRTGVYNKREDRKKMKQTICIVSAQMLPSTGGVERFTLHLGKALLNKGYRVLVLAQNTHGAPEKEDIEGLTVLRFPSLNLLAGRFPTPKPGAEWRRMHRLLMQEPIDYMLVNTRIYPFVSYTLRQAKKRGIPAVLLDHSTGHMAFENPVAAFLAGIYEHLHTAVIKHYRPHFYGVSKSVCQWLCHFHIKADGVLYNAVDVEEIQCLLNGPAEDWRKKLGVYQESTVVVYAGRLVPEKGIAKLQEAVRLANWAGGNLVLVVAGGGVLLDKLKQQQNARLHVLGSLPFAQVVQLMDQGDIFVLPTDYPEGFPTSVLEAAAVGCFCITTPAGGSKELISSREYGVILEENTPQALCRALLAAAGDPEGCKACAKAAQQRVRNDCTWQTTAPRRAESFASR